MGPAMVANNYQIAARDQRVSILESVFVGQAFLRGLRRRVVGNFRRGGDSLAPVRELEEMSVLLLQQMVRSHLRGLRRALRGLGLSLASEFVSPAHTEAIAGLQARIKLTDEDLGAIEELYSARATQVATNLSRHLERKLGQAISVTQELGMHVRDGAALMAQEFKSAGLDPASPNAMEAIFRTNSQIAYSAGAWQADQHPAVQEILWGYEYTAVGDDRTRATHQAMDGTILPKDHPFWTENYPPNGWNCRCVAIPVTIENRPEQPVEPPATIEVGEGAKQKTVPVRADKDFDFHPGLAFKDTRFLAKLSGTEKGVPPKKPKPKPKPVVTKPKPKPVVTKPVAPKPTPKPSLAFEDNPKRMTSWKSWEEGLTDSERVAFKRYTGPDSTTLRVVESKGKIPSRYPIPDSLLEKMKPVNEDLHSAIRRAPISLKGADRNIYRGMNLDDAALAQWREGKEITLKTWTSTSTSERVARGFIQGDDNYVVLQIKARNGLKLGKLGLKVEKEVMLGRGQKFRVIGTENRFVSVGSGDKVNIRYIIMEEI